MRVFSIRTEPHPVQIGETVVRFQPEVNGAEFAAAYAGLTDVQKRVSKSAGGKASSTKHARAEVELIADDLIDVSEAMRTFITRFLNDDESRKAFAEISLPDRILVELIEYIGELYGGGSGEARAADK